MKAANARTKAGVGGTSAQHVASGQDRRYKLAASATPTEALLARLERVKSTKQDEWLACCPGHDDRTPSLSIRETDDGTLLLRCWAGCTAAEIVAAVGLELRDLFPDQSGWKPGRSPLPKHKRLSIPPRDALDILSVEAHVIVLFARKVMGDDDPPTREDYRRACTALARLEKVRGATL